MFANTIGSSVLRWLNLQLPMKFTRCSCLKLVGRSLALLLPGSLCATAVGAIAASPAAASAATSTIAVLSRRFVIRMPFPFPLPAMVATETRRSVAWEGKPPVRKL